MVGSIAPYINLYIKTDPGRVCNIAIWSGIKDSNLRPRGPKPRALANCANPRYVISYILTVLGDFWKMQIYVLAWYDILPVKRLELAVARSSLEEQVNAAAASPGLGDGMKTLLAILAIGLVHSVTWLVLGIGFGILLPMALIIPVMLAPWLIALAYLIIRDPYDTMSGTTPAKRLMEVVSKLLP
jgi:hypothetical protein